MWAWPDLGAASLRPRALPPVMRKGENSESVVGGSVGWIFQVNRRWLLPGQPGLDGQNWTGQDIEEKRRKQGFLRVAGQKDQQQNHADDQLEPFFLRDVNMFKA